MTILLQHASAFLPTHVVLVNLDGQLHDAIEQMAAFLPALGLTILHVYDGDDADVQVSEINEAQMIRMLPDIASFDLDDPYIWADATYRYHRPAAIQAIRGATKNWHDEHGHARTVILFIGSPRTPLDAVLLGEFPLDAQTFFYRKYGGVALTLRFVCAARRPFQADADLPLAHLLADLEQTYFSLAPFPAPAERPESFDIPMSSPCDTTVWADNAHLAPALRELLRLHGEENARLAGNTLPKKEDRSPIVPPLDVAMRADADRRLVDWLALCEPRFAPRLWDQDPVALLRILDIGQDKERRKDPYANIGRFKREASWDDNLLTQTYISQVEHPRAPQEDLIQADFPYRITEDDRASRIEMARYLSDLGAFTRAVELAEELLEDDPNNRLLNRILGTDLYVAGYRDQGRQILQRCIALTELDPTLGESERADEIATLHYLMQNVDEAIPNFERALEADPLNAHAYQGLILIHRGRGETVIADHWLQIAQRHELVLPLLDGGEAPLEAEPAAFSQAASNDPGTDERRSRWWNFLKR